MVSVFVVLCSVHTVIITDYYSVHTMHHMSASWLVYNMQIDVVLKDPRCCVFGQT